MGEGNSSLVAPPDLWHRQGYHFAALFLLLIGVVLLWLRTGQPDPLLFWTAVAIPILHQVYVWATWRLELGNKGVSRTIGFRCYLLIFGALFIARPVSLILLAWADLNSLPLSMGVRVAGTLIVGVPGLYAIYSVKKCFGFARAAGADHFDVGYRTIGLVTGGIFRYTENGMYLYAFLVFWAIALAFASTSTLIVAFFSHAYIWVHFYVTERPDMNYLYGPAQ